MHRTPLFASRATLVRPNLLTQSFWPIQTNRPPPSGSDILAHPTASDDSGIVTPLARAEVLERVSEQFPPELLNRLDSMLVFNRLSHDSILRVVDLRLRDVAARLAQRRTKLDVDDIARAWLAEKGFSDVYGARAIARVVRSEVLFPLARKMLVGTIR